MEGESREQFFFSLPIENSPIRSSLFLLKTSQCSRKLSLSLTVTSYLSMASIDLPELPDHLVLRRLRKSDFEKGLSKRKRGNGCACLSLFFFLSLSPSTKRQVRLISSTPLSFFLSLSLSLSLLSLSLSLLNKQKITTRLPRPPLAADRRRRHLKGGLRGALRRDGPRGRRK